jgi:SOS-response transcriptional repressor LexA
MARKRRKSTPPLQPQWAMAILALRQQLGMNQAAFAERFHSSSMAISRWERGVMEPPSHSYIELGNLAGDPKCWFFWERAGFRSEDLLRVMPGLQRRLRETRLPDFEIVTAGSGKKKGKLKAQQLVAIPVLKIAAASHGEKSDVGPLLHEAPVESMIAAPRDWCPNPMTTSCLRVRGNSMAPLIYDGYILAVDFTQNDPGKLEGKIVIAWHKDSGLTVSRLRRYDHTEVLQPENRDYTSITLGAKHKWKIVGQVLWWIGKAT